VSFLFNARAMLDYESVGNLLFCLRHCEHILVAAWAPSMRGGHSRLFKIRLALQRFVVCLESYLFTEIEALWSSLLSVFENCDSVLTLL
jgi:hypothetical protein